MRILVTGANGFVGSSLVERLAVAAGNDVRAAVREVPALKIDGVNYHAIGNVGSNTDWRDALDGVQAVVHLAARAHVLNDDPASACGLFREVNVAGAVSLAEQALAAGVKRFVFVSSIGVNGNVTREPFSESSPVHPHAPYAESKYEAEQALTKMLAGTAMELVIVRPPLVYDADAPGNFKRLLGIVDKGIPLPFGLIYNRRSMISRANLVEILELCIAHPAAANELFLVADGEDLSTGQIAKLLGQGMGRSVMLLPVPAFLLAWAAALVGRKSMYIQLCESLQVDAGKVRRLLDWRPERSAEQQLHAAGKAYLVRK
ncbi:NAD-dependent epimerase/dehydratase family protein [Pseudomonas sp. BNK-43-a]|uniref:NAD-dependent epimerase/dehydratase family protein n=1 Tax=unclassified Pseudomonas TaxID=196821 RepID=UPI0039BF56A9